MDKKEEFKTFMKKNPKLLDYIKNNNSSVQKLYEVYDVYGEDESIWKPYLQTNNQTNFTDMFKNIDTNKIQEHIGHAQKALNVIQELTSKGGETIENIKGPALPRPITKFFGD